MKYFLIRFALLPQLIIIFTLSNCTNSRQKAGMNDSVWENVSAILDSISDPGIADTAFLLTDFGAIGDAVFNNKPAFDQAISAASSAGGGQIIVPPGVYMIHGPVHLKSNINLHLEKGSKLIFSTEPVHYLPVVLTSWEGTRLYNYSPFIYAIQEENISITGEGEIDGNASETWSNWKKIQDPDKQLSRKMNNENVSLEDRIFGDGHFLRPHLIQFYECKNILVEDILITDAPFWCLHFIYSRNLQVRGVRYDAQNPNNDGIDPESSEYILIEDIDFDNRDDNIAIKAGRDLEARTLHRSSKNIVVRNCRFKGLNAFAIGSEMSGGVQNVFMENCSFAGKIVNGIYLKGNRDRGGIIENIYVRNIEFDSCLSAIIMDSNYKNEGSCCPPKFRNVSIENVKCNFASDHGISIMGYESAPVENISLRKINILDANVPLSYKNVIGLRLDEVFINGEEFKIAE